MLLAIDVGNTNVVFAIYKGQDLLESWRLRTVPARSCDEYASFLRSLFDRQNIKCSAFTDVIISSVVPEANFHLGKFCKKYLNKEPICVSHDMAGIKIDLDKPSEIGADRLVNAAAVLAHYDTPAIVVDFGTATTFDVIDLGGRYAGGAITPGVNLSVAALQQAAAKLPGVVIERPEQVMGKDTVSAIQSGIYWGYLGMIEGLITNLSREMTRAPFVIATGGLARLFAQDTDLINEVDEELTLKGLLKIYQDHTGGK